MKEIVYFYPEGHEQHRQAGHPERPERVQAISSALDEFGFWQPYPKTEPVRIPENILHAIHNSDYLVRLQEICRQGLHFDADTYTTPESWRLALNSAGGAISVATAVWRREAKRGFALTRPPGHHATSNRAMGFCLLNNVALAAEALIQAEGAKRVAIIDLDLHHGNGTQDIFFTRSDVVYFSTHQYPHYPGTGWLDETGLGAGELCTVNFPLPPFSGDREFFTVMDEIFLPLLERFEPDILLISYGFDPHFDDPLGSLQLTSGGYGIIIRRLVDWADEHCDGRIAMFLEGGYDLRAAKACTGAVVAALLGDTFPDRYDQAIQPAERIDSAVFISILENARRIWEVS